MYNRFLRNKILRRWNLRRHGVFGIYSRGETGAHNTPLFGSWGSALYYSQNSQ